MNIKRKHTIGAEQEKKTATATRMAVNSLPFFLTATTQLSSPLSIPPFLHFCVFRHCHIKCSIQVECFWHVATNFRHTQHIPCSSESILHSGNQISGIISQWQKWIKHSQQFNSLLCLILHYGHVSSVRQYKYKLVKHTRVCMWTSIYTTNKKQNEEMVWKKKWQECGGGKSEMKKKMYIQTGLWIRLRFYLTVLFSM